MKTSLIRSLLIVAVAGISAYSFGQTADPLQSYATFAGGQSSLDGLSFTGLDYSTEIAPNGIDLYPAQNSAGSFTFTGSTGSYSSLVGTYLSVYVPVTANAGVINGDVNGVKNANLVLSGLIEAVNPSNLSQGIKIDFENVDQQHQNQFGYLSPADTSDLYTLNADTVSFLPKAGSPGTLVGNMNTELFKSEPVVTPEPPTLAVFGLAGFGFLLRRKRKTTQAA